MAARRRGSGSSLAGTGAATVVWLTWPVAAALRRRRSVLAPHVASQVDRRWGRLTVLAGVVTAFFAFGAITIVLVQPAIVEAGFLGWLELPIAQRILLHTPLALAVAAACLAFMVGLGSLRRQWSFATTRWHGLLVAASLALVVQLAAWGLIGWGLT